MAITKRAIAIQADKEYVRRCYEQEYPLLQESIKRVPPVVLHGSHNIAVAWKYHAERAAEANVSAPISSSLSELRALLLSRQYLIAMLRGEREMLMLASQ